MPKVIGVTGGISSGKSTVCDIIKEKGYKVIDCDVLGHQILNDHRKGLGFEKVTKEFGLDIVGKDGNIDRKKLSEMIFGNPTNKKKLEDILHPMIKRRLIEQINRCKDEIIFIEVALLFETDFKDLCDKTILVYVDLDNQIWRLMKRDNVIFPDALKKIYAQMPMEDKLNLADYIIDNTNQVYDLEWQVRQLIKSIKESD